MTAVASFQAWLASVDVEQLSDRERVDLVGALERVKGSASATQARATHALRCSREVVAPQDVARSVGAEVALARRESPGLGDRFVGLSRALVTELPETMRALTAGTISERHAVEVVQQSATLSSDDRAELDRRIGPVLGRLGVRGVGNAARRVAAELDAAAVVRRMEAAVRSRRVTVRPAPDGMGYLTVLAPLPEVVGAYASLRARASAVVGGVCADEAPDGRSAGAVMADTATGLLSGRAPGQPQPVELHLVMTDRALMGTGDPTRSVFEPARIPGHGSVPAPVARAWLRRGLESGSSEDAGVGAARVWVRRLYTSPDGRDLVAMDSRRRLFSGLLRRMLVLRDDVCTTPWCEAAIAHADHTVPARDGGPTSFAAGNGTCARCNLGKEAPGWSTRVVVTRPGQEPPWDPARRVLEVTTPLGRVYDSESPPLLGWGTTPAGQSQGDVNWQLAADQDLLGRSRDDGRRRSTSDAAPPEGLPLLGLPTSRRPTAGPVARWVPGRKRPCRRTHALRSGAATAPPTRRPRPISHLERELRRLLT